MIVDAHAHVWRHWPYEPPVPDPQSRARAEQLLWHMDRNGVDHAVVIAASIGGNPDNAADAFAAAEAAGGRLTVFPDLECRWAPHYRTPGAADRLQAALDRYGFAGFTMYLDEAEDGGWLLSDEGEAFLALAERRGLVASLSLMPHQMGALATMARRHPGLTILLHHQMFLGPRSGTGPADLTIADRVAAAPNVWVKTSGPGNLAAPEEEYPYPALGWLAAGLLARFGSARLVWGSDFPVSSRHVTYRQSLDWFRRHGPAGADHAAILGGNMARLLGLADRSAAGA